jgi:hypothetical protein
MLLLQLHSLTFKFLWRLLLHFPHLMELHFSFYAARSLWATDKLLLHFCCLFHVSCTAVRAVHVKGSNSVFATIPSSEANKFCGKLLFRKFSECWGMSQLYLQMHSVSSARWNKKQWFLKVYLCIRAPDNSAKENSFSNQCPSATTSCPPV